MKYKFNEDEVLNMVKNHILGTYDQHYSTDKIQATEFIIDSGMGEGFCMGNIIKYAKRYGKKNGKNKEDLLKIIHYAVILLGSETQDYLSVNYLDKED
jgi:hypothetical protein